MFQHFILIILIAKVNCIVIVVFVLVVVEGKVLIVVFVIVIVIVIGEEDRPPRTYGLGRGPNVGVSIISLVFLGRWY